MAIDIEPAVDVGEMNWTRQTNIVEYARHLEALHRRWDDLRAMEGLDLSAAILEMENHILSVPATTAVDATVQIMLIFSLVEQLRVDRGVAKDQLLDRLEGLATSALGGLTRELDLDLSELGGTRYMPGRGRPAGARR